jgi:protein-export membrane protein SecD
LRRYSTTLLVIAVLVVLAGLTLGSKTISIGAFERTGDNVLGLKLGLDLQGGSHLVYQAVLTNAAGEPITPTADQMDSLRRIIERRVNETGLGEPIIQLLGDDRLLVQMPGVDDPERAKKIIGETAQLEFKHRQLNVPVPVDLDGDSIVSVSFGMFPDPATTSTADVPGSETSTSGLPQTSVTTTAATSTDDGGQGATSTTSGTGGDAPEVELTFLMVEFTDAGAEIFDAVITRMLETAFAVAAGSDSPANKLQIDITGDEFRTVTLPAQFVARVEGTNIFGMAMLSIAGQPIANTIEATKALFGVDPELEFVEIYGAFDEDIGLTGDDLARAYAGTHSATGLPIVNIEFNGDGARAFGELTQLIVDTPDRIAIFLDDEELIAPGVNQVITGGAAFIQGRDFTPERARDISQLLEAGRLPIPIELVQERDVDAILGADSLRKSVMAGLIGLALVLVFMVAYYRVPGLVAAVALIIYGAIVLMLFKLIPVTLTLSGLAAVILSVGMAVDANILIFERMKDELRAGRTLLTSINIGFNRAWPAIRDGNVSTLITCAILFWFADTLGATVVQGFAATLAIGVLVSMFSAIVVSRTLLRLVATTRLATRVSWFAPVGKRFLPEGSR